MITTERAAELRRMGEEDALLGSDYASAEWSAAEIRIYRAAFKLKLRALQQ